MKGVDVVPRSVDAIDQGAFVVRLVGERRHTQLVGPPGERRLELSECGGTVDLGPSGPEEIEVGAVQQQDPHPGQRIGGVSHLREM